MPDSHLHPDMPKEHDGQPTGAHMTHDPQHYVGTTGSYEKRMQADKQRKESSYKLSSTPSVADSNKIR